MNKENIYCFSIHYCSIDILPLRGNKHATYIVNFTDRIIKFKWNGREYVTISN